MARFHEENLLFYLCMSRMTLIVSSFEYDKVSMMMALNIRYLGVPCCLMKCDGLAIPTPFYHQYDDPKADQK